MKYIIRKTLYYKTITNTLCYAGTDALSIDFIWIPANRIAFDLETSSNPLSLMGFAEYGKKLTNKECIKKNEKYFEKNNFLMFNSIETATIFAKNHSIFNNKLHFKVFKTFVEINNSLGKKIKEI